MIIERPILTSNRTWQIVSRIILPLVKTNFSVAFIWAFHITPYYLANNSEDLGLLSTIRHAIQQYIQRHPAERKPDGFCNICGTALGLNIEGRSPFCPHCREVKTKIILYLESNIIDADILPKGFDIDLSEPIDLDEL